MNTATLPKQYEDAQDFLELWGTDYVEFYVGNAKQSAYYFKTAFGFQEVAYAGLETGVTDRTSYVLQQDKIRLVITSSMVEHSDINRHLNEHGDGVKIVALWVPDAAKAFKETTARGAKPFQEPQVSEDENGKVTTSGIYTYGETVHLFVERNDYNGPFLPGYVARSPKYQPESVGLKYIDHMVGNVDWGQMNTWVKFYAEVMGFSQIISFDDNDISTEYTALMSKVMSNGNGRIKFPINEPAEGKKRSQIEEYINFYNGAGVQHLALATDNIIYTIHELRERGVDFLDVPDSYYLDLQDRVGAIDEDIEVLKKYKILVDRDDEGYLLQLFTKPLMDRPTVFIEIIQRKGATSFGKGNFKALFEAIEREQEHRGTL
ncbi:MAG: 4-hydroxyphenylpyruvate dioxygenase [Cryomorphaceae bacterium]|jgi:4-hydroxyphenylpyruvate dioxygenase|nr:4-hydroxyphenylpyruvate dioxygenase [Cryomorphaceae bacterium]MBT4215775.1 4-hydroxyphenylpyruvate dioxygenase [Bacteroidota bacterium]MCO4791763.1 4-hydroxyphenylpyruvate dioxygenase [Flavobacteriales bacterium]MDA7549137.1 4-hydroxyphenylpyruvate dioxygenase [bacterium]MDA7804464.1 4-hydroxyphenylpyruvate dioxygenase [Schleiferiaceae bacterium]